MSSAQSDALRIRGAKPLRGATTLGPDLPILESTLAVAALAPGRSQLRGVRPGQGRWERSQQIEVMLAAWGALGVRFSFVGDCIEVESDGPDALCAPTSAIECGRSPRLLAQLAGVLSGQRFGTQLLASGCPTVPVQTWVAALRRRGAQIAAHAHSAASERLRPPVAVAPLLPSERLRGLDASLPFADATAKDALLLSGLYACGPTVLSEPHVSSDHLERALVGASVPLRRVGSVVALDGAAWDRRLSALGTVRMPGSAVVAAHLASVALALPGSDVTLRDVSVNPSQSGVLDLLRSWGAALTWNPCGDAALREPLAELRITPAAVRGGAVDGELLLRSGDAAAALVLIGALSQRGVRVYERQALGAHADPDLRMLDTLSAAFGIAITRTATELHVRGQAALARAPTRHVRVVDAHGDAALALAACALALASAGETVVERATAALSALFPGFVFAAQNLGASIEYV